MFEAMEHGELRAVYVHRREPGAVRGRQRPRRRPAGGPRPPGRAGHLPHQDRGAGRRRAARHARRGASRRARSRTASGGCSGSARRSTPPEGARDDIEIILRRSPAGSATTGRLRRRASEAVWDELRSLSPMHPACRTRGSRSSAASSGRATTRTAWSRRTCTVGCGPTTRPSGARPRRSPSCVDDPPVDQIDDEFPLRLTTGRRLDSYNTGVQSGGFASPLPRRRDDRPVAGGRRRASGIEAGEHRPGRRPGGARVDRAGPHRPGAARRPRVHDVPLPRRGRHQPAHDRGQRPPVGHRRVQGRRRSGSRSSSRSPRPAADAGWTCTSSTPVRVTRSAPRSTPCSGRPRRAGGRGATASDAHVAFGGGTAAQALRPQLLPRPARGQRPRRLGQPGRARTTSRSGSTSPPAEVYGVATLLRPVLARARPPRVVHVCVDLACRMRDVQG